MKTRRQYIALIMMLMTVLPLAAQQRAYVIYRTDGVISAFTHDEVDSIVYSPIGLDGALFDYNVTQEVWTADSVFRIPIELIDSIALTTPPTVYKDGVFHITSMHIPYLTKVNSGSLVFTRNLPASLRPEVGQKVVSDVMEGLLENGFMGTVVDTREDDDFYYIICEEASVDDIYDEVMLVGKLQMYAGMSPEEIDSIAQARPRKAQRRVSINDWGLTINDGDFTFKDKFDIYLNYVYKKKGDDHYFHGEFDFTNHLDLKLSLVDKKLAGDKTEGANNIWDIVKATKDPSSFHLFSKKKIEHKATAVSIPIATGLSFFLDFGGYFDWSVKAAVDLHVKKDVIYHKELTYDNEELTFISSYTEENPEMSLKLSGTAEAKIGVAAELGVKILSKKVAAVGVTADAYLDTKMELGAEVSTSQESMYDTWKDLYKTDITFNVELRPFYTLLFGGKKEQPKLNKKFPPITILEHRFLPTLTTPSVIMNPDETSAVVTTIPSTTVWPAVNIGYQLFDENGKEIRTHMVPNSYSRDRQQPYYVTFYGLEKGKKYTVKPIVETILGQVLTASPVRTFVLGKNTDEKYHLDKEDNNTVNMMLKEMVLINPVENVTIHSAGDNKYMLRPYYIGRTEVTNLQWYTVMGGTLPTEDAQNKPKTGITYSQVDDFIRRLNAMSHNCQFRLPTEDEWEWAASGGPNYSSYATNDYSGSDDIDAVAWYSGNSENKLHEVATKRANRFGLYDMSGNAQEFVNGEGVSISGNGYVYRGGAYNSKAEDCKTVSRNAFYYYSSSSSGAVGFRLALEVNDLVPFNEIQKQVNNMVRISEGVATMKSQPSISYKLKPYNISRYEVTNALWNLVMGSAAPSVYSKDKPKTNVPYSQVQEFITKLNELSGRTFRLPTEDEWEWAALGGKKDETPVSGIYAGGKSLTDVGWFAGNSRGIVRPVGRKAPNALGLYDMNGNVHEYVDGEGVSISGNGYVYRGGAYNSNPEGCTIETRNAFYYYSSSSSGAVGFRLVMEDEDETPNPPTALQQLESNMIRVEGGDAALGAERNCCFKMNSFYMSKYVVTNQLWFEVMGGNKPNHYNADKPKTGVSYSQVDAFFQKLRDKTKRNYRLPTENEWEYAARGGVLKNKEEEIGNHAWYADNSRGIIRPVGRKNANALGLYDMFGNVHEFVNGEGVSINGNGYVYRGGAYNSKATECTATGRNAFYYYGSSSSSAVGFRIVRDETVYDEMTSSDKIPSSMVYVPGGKCSVGKDGFISYNLKPYYISKYEVTNGLWAEVMGQEIPSRYTVQKPKTNVSYSQVLSFINKLNELTHGNYRLPTEDEWEWAARGAQKSKGYTYAGSDKADETAWYQWNSFGVIRDVARKPANELGLYDMSGNAHEFVNGEGVSISGNGYVYRGGAYNSSIDGCTVESRNAFYYYGSSSSSTVGFRLVKSAEDNRPSAIQSLRQDMVAVPGGQLTVGGKDREFSGFYLSKFEVTNQLWYEVYGGNRPDEYSANKPKTGISYSQVQSFIKDLNKLTGHTYRLPTEAEWQWAAQGGREAYSSVLGSDDAAWHSGNSRGIVRFVGRKDPNTLGLYDMFGNVHEFVDGQGVTIDGNGYVYRGGAYNSNIGSCNAESRNAFYYYSSSSSSNVGFRLASDTRP